MRKRTHYLFLYLYVAAIILFVQSCSEKIDLQEIENRQIKPWGLQQINVETLWSQGFKGQGVKIAVMDSGVDYNHPEFAGKLRDGYNAIHPSELPQDDYEHGTLVTGIISANDNSIGIVGVAPEAEIYPVKVLNEYGEGEISNIAKAIDWIIKNNIQVINMSFSILKDKAELKIAIDKAIEHGIVIVASSHNSNGGDAGFPASYPGVISVTSVDSTYKPLKGNAEGKVDFSAPGKDIITTSLGGGYKEIAGNSFAAPYITGVCALLLQKGVSSQDIYPTLKSKSMDIGIAGRDNIFGEGFVKLN